ncbi:MAG: hypothetical protein A2X12_05465 [Bacteroidetes bacterium GWE2_29_8]|nr:MAG: hypothetical protein A2X12_05465 [Bacteroidetes bacterium GWE2_29_8]
MKLKLFFIILFLLFTFSLSSFSQDRFLKLSEELESLSTEMSGLDQKVEVSVNGVTIQELLRGIGISNKLNIIVDQRIDVNVVSSFSDVKVKDLLVFLCKRYDLDITFIGNIISVIKYSPPVKDEKPVIKPNITQVEYDNASKKLSLDIKDDSLSNIAKALTKATGKNIICMPDVKDKIINGFMQNMPFENVLEKLALINNINVRSTDDNTYIFEKIEVKAKIEDEEIAPKSKQKNQKSKNQKSKASNDSNDFEYNVENINRISISAQNIPILDILREVSTDLNINYFIYSEIKDVITLNVVNVSFEQLLKTMFNGTKYTFEIDDNIYLIGERMQEALRKTKVIQLQYRSVVDVIKSIPQDLKKDVEIKEYPELNSIILCGSGPIIKELEIFIREIDKVVPVISIEVLIIDYQSGYNISTGISAGIGTSPIENKTTLLPNLAMDMNASTINKIINSINGWGTINLGKVTSDFYLSISALENDQVLKVRSTPKMATLNGHEAKLSIGKTEYYLEESNNVIGSQNPQNIITKQYKSVRADLSLAINPIVSGDDQITLDIKVDQSDFTARISKDAPPGQVSRTFSSTIRVKNGEMILLGGLEESSLNNTGSGIPILNRIPVLKWFFSSRTREKKKNKLNIFIKPNIIY